MAKTKRFLKAYFLTAILSSLHGILLLKRKKKCLNTLIFNFRRYMLSCLQPDKNIFL